MLGVPVLLLLVGTFLGVLGFMLSSFRFLSCLIVLENLNVLLLVCCLLLNSFDTRSSFVALLVMFTVEIVLGLVILTRIWSAGSLIGILGW